jgi:NDP-sugar pyrophosphorylase family protein
MRCLLDTTINLKQLVSQSGEKLMLLVNGEPMLRQQFQSMSEAGVTSVFVLIEKEATSRGVISREALRFGYTPTFLEVEPELIRAKKSLMAAEKYMKDEFIYLPANRLVPASVLRSLIKCPVNSHQVASLLFTGKQHPQLNKPSVYRVEYNRENNVRVTGEQTSFGYDIGVYKCGTIVFKLIDKVAQSRGFSWNRLQAALSRAGRSFVVPTENSFWAVIESQDDIPILERLTATETVKKLPLNDIDKATLGTLYAKLYSAVASSQAIRKQGSVFWILLAVIGCGLLTSDSGLMTIAGGLLASSAIATYPLIEFISAGTSLTVRLKPVVLSSVRILVLTLLSLAAAKSFGFGAWIFMSLLLLGVEVFLLIHPVTMDDEKIERVFQSFVVHAAVLLLASVFVLPILMLVIFGSLTALMGLLKGHQVFREMQREKHS